MPRIYPPAPVRYQGQLSFAPSKALTVAELADLKADIKARLLELSPIGRGGAIVTISKVGGVRALG